ncbi:hypothetical protein [Paenibacillus sp. D51F]
MIQNKNSQYQPKSLQAVIDNKMYDVTKSELVADLTPGWYSLYKTKKGNYFITKNRSESLIFDLVFRYDALAGFYDDIKPMSQTEVIEFLNKIGEIELIKKEFPSIEDA